MTTHIQRWGNSLAVRLPKEILKKSHFTEGESVYIESKEGVVVLKPAAKKDTLESLVKKITPKNRHEEVSWGKRVGKEIW